MQLSVVQRSFRNPGIVSWIGVRPYRNQNVVSLQEVKALEAVGLEGDHYANPGGLRQVTLFQAEHLITIASFLGVEKIDPSFTRRNILIEGFNILSLKGIVFYIGESVLEYTGDCHPCSKMESTLGSGGYHAMRGLGGITAKILKSGLIRLGDQLRGSVS
jgi:MOSC domain-containing protein YiiM